jgi:hypothetical protein
MIVLRQIEKSIAHSESGGEVSRAVSSEETNLATQPSVILRLFSYSAAGPID